MMSVRWLITRTLRSLAAGERAAVLADQRFEAVGQGVDPVEQPGLGQDGAQLVVGGGRAADPQVRRDRGVEQVGGLEPG
jgi:hypothetical protein